MTSCRPDTALLLQQRSVGRIDLRMGCDGPQIIREAGAAKVRLPRGSAEAILINTSGGLAGGDEHALDIACAAGASLTVTSQAAERVYRTLGPPARIAAMLQAEAGSSLHWLPQETILFDGASLERRYEIRLARNATFIALEPLAFGRREMGETIRTLHLSDRWRIYADGNLIHADELRLDGPVPSSIATLGGAGALATVVIVSPDAERYVDAIRNILGPRGGASAWNGKLIARAVAADGHSLRKLLIPMLMAVLGSTALPKVWTM
jgi:urease accessory protein